MTTNRLDLLTPVGRMVQGDPFEAQTTDMKGKPLTTSTGAPRVEYFLAVAVPKSDPAINEFWAQLQQMAAAGFPGGQSGLPDFSWKIVDGDSPKYAGKDGFAGCWVIRMSSGYEIKAYTAGGASQIVDPAQLKRGYYVRCYVSIKPNGDATYPGMYINPSMVELIGYGEEIQGGPDAAATFGAAPAALPAGASATPVAGAPLAPPAALPPAAAPPAALPPAAAPPAALPPAAAPPAAAPPAAVPPAAVPPALPPAAAPPAAVPPVAAPPVAAAPDFLNPKQMTALAAGATYESFIGAGWTDQQLIDGGYMVAPIVPF